MPETGRRERVLNMTEYMIPLNDIPAEGREFSFSDQSLWRERWEAFELGLEPAKDIEAVFTLMAQDDDSVLVRGRIAGAVKAPCDRCAETFEVEIESDFELFEESEAGDGMLDGEEVRIVTRDGQLHLDMGAILWEEFALALPVKPLCSETCEGLCPHCGKPSTDCECSVEEEGDPRLAVLRNLKVK